MLIIIAKIVNKEDKVEAVRVYDTINGTCKDYSIQRARKAVRLGLEVIGLKYTSNGVNFENTNIFSFAKLPRINGAGIPLSDDATKMVYSGWRGFAELKKYYVIDYKGIEAELTEEQFISLAERKLINGVCYTPAKKIFFYSKLNRERF